MTDTLETLIVKQAITETLHRYCYAMDQNSMELGEQVWHPDGTAHYGPETFDGPARGFMEQTFELHRRAAGTSHQVSNILIAVDGDRATSTCYAHACIRVGDGNDIVVRGRYLDTWSCRAGDWRIDDRRLENDLVQVIPTNDSIGI